MDFYRRVYEDAGELDIHRELKEFIPRFHGVTNIEFVGEGSSRYAIGVNRMTSCVGWALILLRCVFQMVLH